MDVNLLFPSAVARSAHPEFLATAKAVVAEYIARADRQDATVCHSEPMFDERLDDLLMLIAKESFLMLSDQGYNMSHAKTEITEFWSQEFLKNGQHIEHVHALGAQVTGFYFVDVPDDSSNPMVFDPRYGKRQINLPEANRKEVSYASEQVVFEVQEGDLLFFNSWLPHGFTKHLSDKPFRFIHFNVAVGANQNEVEVI